MAPNLQPHITLVLADPLFVTFPHLSAYKARARSVAQMLPVTSLVTVAGNHQAYTLAWELFRDLYPSHTLVNTHNAQSASNHGDPTMRQFTPLYKKWSTSKWNKTTKTFDTTFRSTTILAEGDKDQLIDVNALDDAWTRATNTRKFTPDYVLILDPYNRIAGPPLNGISPPNHIISAKVMQRAIADCVKRQWPHTVVTG